MLGECVGWGGGGDTCMQPPRPTAWQHAGRGCRARHFKGSWGCMLLEVCAAEGPQYAG